MITQEEDVALTEPVRQRYTDALREYFFVGGMPGAVRAYQEYHDFTLVREEHEELLHGIYSDFIRHIPKSDAERTRLLWDSIPFQLGKENKKFQYKIIKQGGRAAEFAVALQWLKDTGLIHKVYRVEDPQLPLSMHHLPQHFKIYLVDIGLLGALGKVLPDVFLLQGSDLLQAQYGAFAEQFVVQDLKCHGIFPEYYWAREAPARAELDFLLELAGLGIVPLEVKSGHQTRAKSLTLFRQHFHPKYAVRTSLNQERRDAELHDIPLYMISRIARSIGNAQKGK